MDRTNEMVAGIEKVAEEIGQHTAALTEIQELQLALVGGGIADVVF